jgi:Flp pilus assembly protein TadD
MVQGKTAVALVAAGIALVGAGVTWVAWFATHREPVAIIVDYPLEGAVFPPEFPAPLVQWRDPGQNARAWSIDVTFGDAATPAQRFTSKGEPPQVGAIDQRAVGATNKLPELTPEEAASHTWRPDPSAWDAIKKGSIATPAVLTITGYSDEGMRRAVSVGRVSISTSTDPVGAPIFYRDVPLMPSAGEKGVIKPLDQKFVPLIAWRLRNVAETGSKVVMEGVHSCSNCHSASFDGKTMGMDLDGPRNDKGMYALFPIQSTSTIDRSRVIEWSSYRGKLGGKLRVGFMSQVSPDGQYVVTMINDPGKGQTEYQRRSEPADLTQNYYIANFTDYRFLQVFYPTRGVLAWYSKATGMLQPLPGADDPGYVHTNATWSPDGSYLVFARAKATDAYPAGKQLAEKANDPNETPMKYDLYRVPFNGGRGGMAEPIAGASNNGMSNSFPKITPDGRFLIYVQAKNGLLMRPDGKLYIVPVEGGTPRLMRANTPLMNSWHSISPNGRWMVFSSKSRSPYTRLFLTHLDEQGNDTPAVMIENSTAANRAVNIPEFLNVPPDTPFKIDNQAAQYFRLIDLGAEAMNRGDHAAAVPLLQEALAREQGDPFVHNSYGSALAAIGRLTDAIPQFRKAVELSPDYPDAYNNLAAALVQSGKPQDAIPAFRKAIEQKPSLSEAHAGLGGVLAQRGQLGEAIPHLAKAVELSPKSMDYRANLCLALSLAGRPLEAIPHAKEAVALSNGQNPLLLDLLGRLYAQAHQLTDAIEVTRRALDIVRAANDVENVREMSARLAAYQSAVGGR